jgi:Arc/MetJ-type ribon-helix-helix transcriptional regulator
VKAGAYASETEVVCAALTLLEGDEREAAREQARLSKAIEAGWKQVQNGQTRSLEEVMARLEERKRNWDANPSRNE